MSRRASNSVKLARKSARKIGTKLDRNGIPVLDHGERNHCEPTVRQDVWQHWNPPPHGYELCEEIES